MGNTIDSIIDDTDENFSSKIKKMNLIGSPFQIIIGKQTDDNLVEFKEIDQESKKIKLEQAIKIIKEQKEKN
jgi:prolyl-tRNA synthetase